jgi:hypothetical protein
MWFDDENDSVFEAIRGMLPTGHLIPRYVLPSLPKEIRRG